MLAQNDCFRKRKFLRLEASVNEQEAAKITLLSRAAGASFIESWTAIAYANFLKVVEELK